VAVAQTTSVDAAVPVIPKTDIVRTVLPTKTPHTRNDSNPTISQTLVVPATPIVSRPPKNQESHVPKVPENHRKLLEQTIFAKFDWEKISENKAKGEINWNTPENMLHHSRCSM
jgi:hypothetical protein